MRGMGFGFGFALGRPRPLAGASTGTPTPTPAPSWSVQPSITGTPTVGQTLTGSDGTISNGTVSARAWLRGGSAISGATGGTYLLVEADEGENISYRVTASGAGGSAQATSDPVGPVDAAPEFLAPALTLDDDTTNPPQWSVTTGDAEIGDTFRLIWDDNSGFTTSDDYDHVFSSDDVLNGYIDWEAIVPWGPFTPDDTMYWKIEVYRSAALLGTSNTISALIPEAPAPTGVTLVPSDPVAIFNVGFGSSTHTFEDVDFVDGLAVIPITSSHRRISGVTVGGNAATMVSQSASSNDNAWAGIFQVAVAAGIHDIVLTGPSALAVLGISPVTLIGASATVFDTAERAFGFVADPQSTTAPCDVATDGLGIAVAYSENDSNPTWDFGTEFSDLSGARRHTAATFDTTGTPAVSGLGSGTAMAAASWELA